MNLILPLTFRAGMVIDQHPTCVPPDPPSLDLYSGQNLLALFIQLNNNWQGIKKRSRAIIHVSPTENVLNPFLQIYPLRDNSAQRFVRVAVLNVGAVLSSAGRVKVTR